MGPSIEINVAMFIPKSVSCDQHRRTQKPPADIPRLPKVAKKTRRLMGLLKEDDSRKVARMKTMPMREKTDETLSATTITTFCSGVSDGDMMVEFNSANGPTSCRCRREIATSGSLVDI